MRVDVQDKHYNSVFTIFNDRIEVRGSSTHLVIKGNLIQEWGGRILYEIRDDRLEDRIDNQNYWLKSLATSGTIEGKHFFFNFGGKRVHTKKGDLLIFSEEVKVGLAAALALEYVTGRAFERGLSDLEKLGVLLGGAEMILALEKDGFGLKNLARFGFYHNLSPQGQNSLLIALGTKYAVQNGLSLRKVMGLIAFNSLERNTQKALVNAYSGYKFLKKGNFTFLGKALIASSFDEMTINRFVKFYAAKEFFEQNNILGNDQETTTEEPLENATRPYKEHDVNSSEAKRGLSSIIWILAICVLLLAIITVPDIIKHKTKGAGDTLGRNSASTQTTKQETMTSSTSPPAKKVTPELSKSASSGPGKSENPASHDSLKFDSGKTDSAAVVARELDEALLAAALEGDLSKTKKLLSDGASVDSRNSRGKTSLMLASSKGHKEVMNFLLDSGADVNAYSENRRTSLIEAIIENHISAVGLLLMHKPDVNARDEFNNTAIHHAVLRGNIKAARLLIEHGVDLAVHDFNGKTPLEIASDSKDVELIKLLGIKLGEHYSP